MNTHLYRAYGTWIESAIDLPWLAATERPAGYARPELMIGLAHSNDVPDAQEPMYRSAWRTPSGEHFMLAYRLGDCDLLQFPGAFSFTICDNYIEVDLVDPVQRAQVQVQLLGPVLAYWLERRGALALHASAVVIDDVGVAFTTNSRGGKSTLAASFVQAGAALLTDDVLPCQIEGSTVIGNPGFPSMRMWPSEAERFVGNHRILELVHPAFDKRRTNVGDGAFGDFYDLPAPLACIYQPLRRENEDGPARIEITPLSRREALIELTRMSFVARLAHAALNQNERIDLLARIARLVPVKRLSYPSGYEHLPCVHEAVLNDARETLSQSISTQRLTA